MQTVAAALEIHPYMLSKWRKDVKDGRLRGRPLKAPPAGPAREIAQLQTLERKYAELKEEHDLLRKAIRFWSARKARSSPSSTTSSPGRSVAAAPRGKRVRCWRARRRAVARRED